MTTMAPFSHDGLQLAYRDSAPDDRERPVVLLLHGFPDSSAMWQAQIAFLHDQGFRVLAPDTRGCGDSAIAPQRADYHYTRVLSDFIALLDHLGIDQVQVVGHDWGAVFAWLLAGHYPSRVTRLIAISVGHPTAYAKAGLRQKFAGWYIVFFLMGGFAERRLLGKGRLAFERAMPGHPQPEEVRERMRRPGRLTAALRVYRANIGDILLGSQPRVTAPTTGIWSDGDTFLTEAQMRGSRAFVDGEWHFEALSGGHWIPLEQPDRLNTLLAAHLDAPAGR